MTVVRRARPLLGTLVEIGVAGMIEATRDGGPAAALTAAIDAAFAEIARLERLLSRFDASSDIGRFNALAAGAAVDVSPDTATVLDAAAALQAASDGAFDVSTGTAPRGWRLQEEVRLVKLDPATRLDLGGIGKGYAVDAAVAVLRARACAAGWVNAGGDLRAFGPIEVPVLLRDEDTGGVHPFGLLTDGAFATSRFGAGARAVLARGDGRGAPAGDGATHVSVTAPGCLLADALTKVVAATGAVDHALVTRHGARAFLHGAAGFAATSGASP